MHIALGRLGAVVAGASVLVILGGVGGAVGGTLITSARIADETIRARDIGPGAVTRAEVRDGTVGVGDLSNFVRTQLAKQAQDGVDGVDGKDGVSNLIAGAGYHTTWVGDGGATLQTVREECPAGQYALGGGWSTWGGDKDLGGDNQNIRVTVSAPYFEGEYLPVDEAGNFRATEWVIKGYNLGDTDQIVRAWVTCATVN